MVERETVDEFGAARGGFELDVAVLREDDLAGMTGSAFELLSVSADRREEVSMEVRRGPPSRGVLEETSNDVRRVASPETFRPL